MKLYTEKGSVIKRSKYGVGKDIGGCIYVHRMYMLSLPIPEKTFCKQLECVASFDFNYIKWNKKNNDVTFFSSPDFNFSDEPMVGRWIKITAKGNIPAIGKSTQLLHHKWLWVSGNYFGFDVEESFERSREWLKIKNINFSKIGNKDYWYPLLKKNKIKF